MGVRWPSVSSNTLVNSSASTTTETIVVTTPALNLALDFEVVMLMWQVLVSLSAGTTAVNMRLRRGPLVTSQQMTGVASITATASNVVLFSGSYIDTPGAIAGQQYSLTFAAAGAGSTSSFQDGHITAICL